MNKLYITKKVLQVKKNNKSTEDSIPKNINRWEKEKKLILTNIYHFHPEIDTKLTGIKMDKDIH